MITTFYILYLKVLTFNLQSVPRRKLEPTFPVQFVFKSSILDLLDCSIDLSDSNAGVLETIPILDEVLFPLAVRGTFTENRVTNQVIIKE